MGRTGGIRVALPEQALPILFKYLERSLEAGKQQPSLLTRRFPDCHPKTLRGYNATALQNLPSGPFDLLVQSGHDRRSLDLSAPWVSREARPVV